MFVWFVYRDDPGNPWDSGIYTRDGTPKPAGPRYTVSAKPLDARSPILQMKGGTIVLFSGAEIRTGAWMMRGTIISLKPIKLLPTFSYACTYTPTFLRLYAKHLATLGRAIPINEQDGAYHRYSGDSSVPGKGEILVWQPRTGA